MAELAATAHAHGARIVVDAAQLAPHRPVDLRRIGVDYLVFSGHKLYAPFGAGVLVGRADWLRAAPPYLRGGGATSLVTEDGRRPGRGAPTGTRQARPTSSACTPWPSRAPRCPGTGTPILAHERALLARLRTGLAGVPGLRPLAVFGRDAERVGVVSFTVDDQDPGLLAAALSAEHGIGVRDGAFCAHLLTHRLTGGRTALRASIGLGTTAEHVDRLVGALRELVAHGPRWTYQQRDGRWVPTPDPRPLPPFLTS